ncbi:MAG: MarR family winged helix-turn-helix transcriptional regulator [Mediterraneibacter sp.]|nr:MarR family winged helix-turn-helix transcriptional regulator [Candidatus Mediterraneibacter caccogallinarum]
MDKKETYDPARDDVGRLINKISHQLKRQMCFHQEESELTNMQKRVLHYILFQSLKKDIYQKDIEKEFQIRRSTATGILQLLEKNGFVIRETVEWDARLKKLVPTAKAEGVREEILSNIRYMETILKQGISQGDMRVCMRVLEQMSTNLLGNEKNNRGEEKQNHE